MVVIGIVWWAATHVRVWDFGMIFGPGPFWWACLAWLELCHEYGCF